MFVTISDTISSLMLFFFEERVYVTLLFLEGLGQIRFFFTAEFSEKKNICLLLVCTAGEIFFGVYLFLNLFWQRIKYAYFWKLFKAKLSLEL